ncbi:hypothetical protein DEO72_LG11g1600 [Vigna unguiculata]|uniref:Uncharacterized protein n=1 Tax=Vigna unguiculata TaxID=3917 RepID=A0A4D6NS45_VIGUN|nr:hypothetical protein DEO72_LG11g1600 [Vigna unguiculata]
MYVETTSRCNYHIERVFALYYMQSSSIGRGKAKLARIVAKERLLLQEFNDVFHDICVLEKMCN